MIPIHTYLPIESHGDYVYSSWLWSGSVVDELHEVSVELARAFDWPLASSGNLTVQILDFTYEESEYPKLKGKSFQVLLVEDDPAHLPFVAIKDGPDVHCNKIYTRRATATVEANHDELQRIINRRLETGYSSGRELDLRTHLEQLQVLYEQLSPYSVKSIFGEAIVRTVREAMFTERVPNPRYPEEDYETFVARAIARKKRRIEMELDIEVISPPEMV